MNSNEKRSLKRGTKVLMANRQGGAPTEHVIYKREVMKSYYPGGEDLVYYHLVGEGLLYPAQDVVAVV
ncbi:hypothetical protein SEA_FLAMETHROWER_44 [Microbacterium phage FlameThrower]|uniref:hypothetical protein n=1 Tax=Microbacterium phage Katzastrophic TaxID=2912654 RepID=UPI002432FC41|nr:hypothetical protein QDW18_gp45 [Microbacterium phage Katzastrophic]UKH48482.1 hypothetical protein SEA_KATZASTROPHIC_45 [Microbacterium phage Katzastrophic]WNO28759.1 hypothetical protein SEA_FLAMETHROWER_44 [Microbacterium phage FlameThrower]